MNNPQLITIQNALSGGELSPSLFGRTDLAKYKEGTSTCRNFFADYRGGVQSRMGGVFVGQSKTCGDSIDPPRLIPFQFNLQQGYCLEFGDRYIRFIFQGAYITETPVSISAITKADPGVITAVAHGLSVGDWVSISGISGMTELNSLVWIVGSILDVDRFTLIDMFDNVVDTTNFTTYISGGEIARIYTVSSPYSAEDLPYLKYTQSADIMTLACVNSETSTEYPPYDLKRFGNTNWTMTAVTFAATMVAPTGLTALAYASNTPTTWYSYIVTAVNSTTGEESIASTPVNIQNCDISIYAGTNSLSWSSVANATSYNIYASTPSYGAQITSGNLYGFVGISFGTSFNDTNIEPDFTTVPPQHFDPFAIGPIQDVVMTASGSNYSQSTVGYSVTTSTGTDFAGTPVVTNGQVSGFVIQNQGQGYVDTDTIAFTDSGGGLGAGTVTFGSNPGLNSNISFNGFQVKFIAENGTPDGKSVQLGASTTITAQNLAAFLNASSNGNVIVAVYAAVTNVLHVTYKTPGTVGNSYTLSAGSSGATVSGATLTGGGVVGSGATATLTVGPQSQTYPSVVAYYQQRRVFAASLTNPETYWMSQPGLFYNMDTSIPTTASDSITGTPFSQSVNGIQWMIPMPGGLVTLTGNGAWQVNGGTSSAITPADQTATPQAFNGCNPLVPPVRINYDILYVQAKGNKVRDLSYNWWIQIYTGTDLTALSNHLFDGHQIIQWAWSEEPYKLLWAVRDDGIMVTLTFLKEGDSMSGSASNVYAWSRHDTLGQYKSVCSVIEPPIDAVYYVAKRFINNRWKFYIERLYTGLGTNGINLQSPAEDYVCHDASLQTAPEYPDATLYPSAATGMINCIADSPVFTAGDVGMILRADGGIVTITTYNSPQSVTGTVTQDLTTLIPNSSVPLPVTSGSWSLLPQITIVQKLNHLIGQTVSILADGSVSTSQTVTEIAPGVIGVTLPEAASKITIGLPYTCQVQSMYIDREGQESVQTKRKNVVAVGARVEATRGLELGANQVDASTIADTLTATWSRMNEIKEQPVTAGNAIPLFTGDHYKTITGGWDSKGQIACQQTYPLPAKILALVSYWSEGDTK